MITVNIIGAGNVAYHLYRALSLSPEVKVLQVTARDQRKLEDFVNPELINTDFSKIKDCDVHLICVSDSAIAEIAKAMFGLNGLVVHTSGATSINLLHQLKRYGVFYPLQTFSKQRDVSFSEIPICIEAEQKNDLALLKILALKISNDVREITSAQRKTLHLSAIFVNNFTNHLLHLGNEIVKQNNLDFNILKPLLKETVMKLEDMPPFEAQTGPARRGDQITMKEHLAQLSEENQKKIYTELSESIQKTYGKEL
ncbi:Rossmann-like and DUF2520 domain-containing protein [Euzebyella saccharophila]|uniref:Rossmann-like and DUF2520 domain-containing protein n=1 Tax=Euzebyella saccharophila TaxID=679664 RepID=A0ABV8JTW0_9FLAO|nr:Rossmann-like and DUF2520 domain-containing protein [Euzebyella saccharophila]